MGAQCVWRHRCSDRGWTGHGCLVQLPQPAAVTTATVVSSTLTATSCASTSTVSSTLMVILAHHRMIGLPRILRDLYHHSGSCDLLLPRQNMIKRRKIGILSGRLNGRRHTILADVL